METLELKVSERTIRKLKAYSALNGFTSPSQMELKAAELFDKALSEDIVNLVSGLDTYSGKSFFANNLPVTPLVHTRKKEPPVFPEDGLSDGLGDDALYEEEEPSPETDEYAMVPKHGGLSDEDLEHEMDVDDPRVEAKEGPPANLPPSVNAEDMFSALAGIQLPDDEEIDHRILKRKKRLVTKAKVSLIHDEPDVRM
jgi:hypothetical protein